MAGIELRTFDEDRDMNQVVELYNTAFGPLRPYYSWPVTVERFRDKVLSHWEFRPEGLLCAYADNELAGFALAGFRSQSLLPNDDITGDWGPVFLSALAVAPQFRRRGIGRRLVEGVIDFAGINGRAKVKVSANPRAPMSFFIGVQEDWRAAQSFFLATGFDFAGMNQNMVRSIVDYRVPEATRSKIAALEAEGYACREYRSDDLPALQHLLDEHGWAYWNLDLLSKVGAWTTTRPFMETCFLDCATEMIYGPDEIGVVIKDGRMLSFCAQTINPLTRKAYLGPMLTSTSARNLGLGSVALQLSLELAARKGAVVCDLWTGSGGAITHFYRKSGFNRVLNWLDYELPISCP